MTQEEFAQLAEQVKLHGASVVAPKLDALIKQCLEEALPKAVMHFVSDACMDLNRFRDAGDILRALDRRFGLDDIGYNNLGFCVSELGDENGARELWRQSIERNANNASSIRNLALISSGEESAELWRKYLALKPADAEACYQLVVALFNSERLSDAAAELTRGIQVCPDSADLRALAKEIAKRKVEQ
jgi:tetratricopeptide (TPR) repeat protein